MECGSCMCYQSFPSVILVHSLFVQIDVFAVPQYERPCPEFKKPDTVLANILSSPTCRGVLVTARPWYWPVTLTRAWCLYEVSLARRLDVPIQLLLTEEICCGTENSVTGGGLPVRQLTQFVFDPGNAPLRILELLASRSPSPMGSSNSIMFASPRALLNERRGQSLSLAGIHAMLQLPTLPENLKRRQSFMPLNQIQQRLTRPPQISPFEAVIAAVDACLECVDLSTSSSRLPADVQTILSLANQELGGVVGVNHACRQHLRPHILAALLTGLLRSGREAAWEGARKLVEAGGFLQWPSPSLVIEPVSRMGTPDEAAAFLCAALRSRAPPLVTPRNSSSELIYSSGSNDTSYDTCTDGYRNPSLASDILTAGCNPLEDIVFLAPPELEGTDCSINHHTAGEERFNGKTKISDACERPVQPTDQQRSCRPEAPVSAFMVLPRDTSPPPKIMRCMQQPVQELTRQRSRRRATWLSGAHSDHDDDEDDDDRNSPEPSSSPRRYADSGLVSFSSRRYSRTRDTDCARDGIEAGLRRLHRRSSAAAIAKADKIFNPSNCALSAEGVATLAGGLIGNICLTRLVLSGHPFGCDGMTQLCKALAAQPTALACLQVRSCKIGPSGGAALGDLLSRMLHCPCLTDVDVGENSDLGPQVGTLV